MFADRAGLSTGDNPHRYMFVPSMFTGSVFGEKYVQLVPSSSMVSSAPIKVCSVMRCQPLPADTIHGD